MIHNDYIMRLILQIVQILAALMKLKQEKGTPEVKKTIDGALRSMVGLDLSLVRTLSSKDIAALLDASDENLIGHLKCAVVARLLREAETLEGDEEEQRALRFKAAELYRIHLPQLRDSEVDEALFRTDLVSAFKSLQDDFSDDDRHAYFLCFQDLKLFAEAENILFQLKENGFPDIQGIGLEFYSCLRKESDASLEKGNLSREEVAEGLRDFQGSD